MHLVNEMMRIVQAGFTQENSSNALTWLVIQNR